MIWQTYYTPLQYRRLYGFCKPLDVTDRVTPYFENTLILEKFAENGDDPYFGLLSHTLRDKGGASESDYARYMARKYDVYVLNRHAIDRKARFINATSRIHPHFGPLFDWLLESIGKSYDWRKEHHLYPSVQFNFVVARSEIYGQYIEEYLQPAVNAMEAATGDIREMLWADAKYKPRHLTNEEMREKFTKHMGIAHYPHHPFLLERLWSVFFYQMPEKQRQSITIWPKN